MATKDLKYFMREELKTEDVVEVPGPSTILDEEGNIVMIKVKRLTRKHIDDIYDHYRSTVPALDRNKKPYVVDGKMVMKENKDYSKALRHLIADALVYPNLRDEELMKFYNCIDVTEMPRLMFTQNEFIELTSIVNQVLGLAEPDEKEQEEDLEDAKN